MNTIENLREEIKKTKEDKINADKKLADLEKELLEIIRELQALGDAVQDVGQPQRLMQFTNEIFRNIPQWVNKAFWIAVIFTLVFAAFSFFKNPKAKGCSLLKGRPSVQRLEGKRATSLEVQVVPDDVQVIPDMEQIFTGETNSDDAIVIDNSGNSPDDGNNSVGENACVNGKCSVVTTAKQVRVQKVMFPKFNRIRRGS